MVTSCSGVYGIVNLVNQKIYVGSAVNIRERIRRHRAALRSNRHVNVHLQRAWRIYGESSFLFVTLEECAPESCVKCEQWWINELDTFTNGYNRSPKAGSQLGFKHSEESKSKISKSLRETPNRSGWKAEMRHTDETRKKMSESGKGKPKSITHRMKIAAANRGKRKSADHLAKIEASKRRKSQ